MSVFREKGSWRSQEGRKEKTPPPLPITRAPFLLKDCVEVQSMTQSSITRSLQAPVLLPLGAFSLRFPSEAVFTAPIPWIRHPARS